jgi:hypothetical protein
MRAGSRRCTREPGKRPTDTSSRRRSSTVSTWASARSAGGTTWPTLTCLPSWADEDNEVVGFVTVGPSRDPDCDGELYGIYVASGGVGERRRRGADGGGARRAARALRRRSCGCWTTIRARAASTRSTAGHRTARRKQAATSESTPQRCGTASRSSGRAGSALKAAQPSRPTGRSRGRRASSARPALDAAMSWKSAVGEVHPARSSKRGG